MYESLAESVLKAAEKAGAHEVEVVIESARDTEIVMKRKAIHSEKDCRTAAMGIRVAIGKKHSFTSCNLPFPEPETLARHAVFLAEQTVEDAYWEHLPYKCPPAKVEGIYSRELAELSYDTLFELAQNLLESVAAVRDVDLEEGHIKHAVEEFFIINSHSLQGSFKTTTLEADVLCAAKRGGQAECSAYDYVTSRTLDCDISNLGEKTARSAKASMGAQKLPTGARGKVLLMPDPASEILFTPLAAAVSGETYLWGTSPLSQALGTTVAAEILDITDDGTLQGGCSSRPRDGEGSTTCNTAIIQKGQFVGLLHSEYTAAIAKCKSTGNAVRTATSDVNVGPSNFTVHKGDASLEELLEALGEGLLVERFSGSVDVTSGLFSGVCKQAHYVHNGEIVYPVKDVTLSGDAFQAVKSISLLGDSALPEYQGILTPACLVEGIEINP
jgi:PmbA protein